MARHWEEARILGPVNPVRPPGGEAGDPAGREAEWVRRAQQGDPGAFEQLYRLHVPRVYGLCLRLVADPVQAEILTQDVFVRVWQKLGTFEGRGSLAGWIRRMTVNLVAEDRRTRSRQARWMVPLREEGSDWDEDWHGARIRGVQVHRDRELAQEEAESRIDLDRALLELPHGARFAFVLHDVLGYPHKEIAAMTGAAVGTVKAQVHRARRLLREILSDRDSPR
jgi:RNA polymerase sigma-70 factor (ECF subfamily)